MGCDHQSEHRRRSAATGRPSDAMFLFFPLSPKGRTVLKHIAEEAVSGLLGVLQHLDICPHGRAHVIPFQLEFSQI